MKRFEVFSGYRQFYVADAELDPDAPEDWTDAHCAQRHNTLKHITALCPEGDISARVIACGPSDVYPEFPDAAEFEVRTEIEVPSGRIGIYGWPRELQDEYVVAPGTYMILFRGYALSKIDSKEDYYGVEIRKKG
ncbi:MAG TPA: hypothetical protein VHC20_06790 [Candidatus Paceibacterota bacterium]|nr:hypothetical protein [Candidatus Paceibacterota bacterium]